MNYLTIWGIVLIILAAIAYLLLLYAIDRQDDDKYWVGIITSIVVFIIGFILIVIGYEQQNKEDSDKIIYPPENYPLYPEY